MEALEENVNGSTEGGDCCKGLSSEACRALAGDRWMGPFRYDVLIE